MRVCKARGCERQAVVKSMCNAHYRRAKRGVKICGPIGWSRVARPFGSTRISKDGYVLIKTKRGWGLEHRYVMEAYLGRKLLRCEEVHHKNGTRTDNLLSNLELWSHSQPPGQRVSDKMAWAMDFIERYGGDYGVWIGSSEGKVTSSRGIG